MFDTKLENKLAEEQCRKIHASSCEVLEKVGVRLDLEEARNILKKAGARIKENGMVCLPSDLVDKALKTVPKQVVLFDRNGFPVMPVKDSFYYYGPGPDRLNMIDYRNNERTKPVLRDINEPIVL